MAWTKTTRKHYRRDGLRYASDTAAKEWILLSPLLPKRNASGVHRVAPSHHHGCDSLVCLRPAANGVLCRKTFRRSRRFSITFTIGATAMFGGG